MSSIVGNVLKISLFGESHSSCVGMTINNFPEGIYLSQEEIRKELNKRKSLKEISTERREDDNVVFLSGVLNDKTTGAPLTFIIENKNCDSSKYVKGEIRPSHADFTAFKKYNAFNDYRGGGHFSGRLTAAIVVLGAICKILLKSKNIIISSHIKQILDICDDEINFTKIEDLYKLNDEEFPVINKTKQKEMIALIKQTKLESDSLGGKLECVVSSLPIGLGEPYFNGVDSYISSLIFSLGGVKGVSFGIEDVFNKKGSEFNDQIRFENEKVKFLSNNNGGVLGGITNGEPLVVNITIKPTPSIFKEQKSINLLTNENINLKLEGRHDPCIVHRLRAPIEALIAFAIVDLIMCNNSRRWE